jgi:hypothetical protein
MQGSWEPLYLAYLEEILSTSIAIISWDTYIWQYVWDTSVSCSILLAYIASLPLVMEV